MPLTGEALLVVLVLLALLVLAYLIGKKLGKLQAELEAHIKGRYENVKRTETVCALDDKGCVDEHC